MLIQHILKVFIVLMVFAGCTGNRPADQAAKHVSVSILPQKYFVNRIAGEEISVNVMVPSGASPVTYEPSPGQLRDMAKSFIYFQVGTLGFENAWMERMSKVNPEMTIVNLSRNIDLIADHHHHHPGHTHEYDPHIWMSPVLVKKISETILESILAQFPEKKETYKSNFKEFMQEVDSLDNYIRTNSNKLPQTILVYHPALGYFASEYGLEQIALESEGKEPTARKLREVIEVAGKEKITRVLVQKAFDSGKAAVLAGELNADIVYYDPLDYDWLKMMWDLVHLLVNTSENSSDNE